MPLQSVFEQVITQCRSREHGDLESARYIGVHVYIFFRRYTLPVADCVIGSYLVGVHSCYLACRVYPGGFILVQFSVQAELVQVWTVCTAVREVLGCYCTGAACLCSS